MADPLLESLRSDVGAGTDETATLTTCLAKSRALVDAYIMGGIGVFDDTETGTTIPDAILEGAYLEVAADLFNRRQAPNGILSQQYDAGMGTVASPIRINRDPLTPAYSLLAPWVLPVSIA